MQEGQINVQSENIFPIIKKFLYSDNDIFLRELISNAVDATEKVRKLARTGQLGQELGDDTIEVKLDTENKTLTISDRGVGMTQEEIEKYINQIAFSGAEDFAKKLEEQGEKADIIGQFGLGFYSAFMVSKKVEIQSRSYQEGAEPAYWECDGSTNYKIGDGQREERGTDIVLHIDEENEEFLEEQRISELLDKYCKFLPVPIKFGTKEVTKEGQEDKEESEKEKETVDNIINNPEPAWTKDPNELEEEDYKNFYRELYPMSMDEPLFHIHLNVDHPFQLTGILYFPPLKNNLEVQKNRVQLYSNQVFVTDNVEQIVPEFLTLLHGVIDSPDIPLNVSRSYLQNDANVRKISGHITKKVADKLKEMFKNDRADFEQKWDDIKVFIQYGILTDDKFFDRVKDVMLFKNVDGKYYTMEEYKEAVKEHQTDKNEKIVFLYTHDKDEQYNFIQPAQERGYDVLLMDSPLVSHLTTRLEQKEENISFARVDADTVDNLIQKEESQESKLSEEQQNEVKPVFEEQVPKDNYQVQFQPMSEKDDPVVITQSEFMRRMKEQQATGGGGVMGQLPEMYNLVVNANHPLVSRLLKEEDEEKKKEMAKQAIDLGKLSQGLLKGEELNRFIKRSVDLIGVNTPGDNENGKSEASEGKAKEENAE